MNGPKCFKNVLNVGLVTCHLHYHPKCTLNYLNRDRQIKQPEPHLTYKNMALILIANTDIAKGLFQNKATHDGNIWNFVFVRCFLQDRAVYHSTAEVTP